MIQIPDTWKTKSGRVVTLGSDQKEGVEFLLKHRHSLLSFGTGLGKTLTSVTAGRLILDHIPDTILIIVCPVKAKKAWKKEILDTTQFPSSELAIYSSNESKAYGSKTRIILCTNTNLNKLRGITEELKEKTVCLMVDEAHMLQDTKSQYYKRLQGLRDRAYVAWGITATPILNALDTLFTIVNFFYPGYLGKRAEFDRRYLRYHFRDQWVLGGRKVKVREIDGYKNLEELQERLKGVLIVRQRQYNLKFANVEKELSEDEYSAYQEVSKGLIDDSDLRSWSRRLHDLQRFVDRAYGDDGGLKALAEKYHLTGISTKEDALLSTLKMTQDRGYSTIIYADYTDTIDRLDSLLSDRIGGKVWKITGSINIRDREKIEDEIQPKDVVLITSAGTESINLQKCNCIIFYDISFSVKTNIQTIGRICRRDTQFPYQYILTLVMKGTIDEYKYRLFHSHLGMVQASVGISNELPLTEDYLMADSRDQQRLKDELLWVYKGKGRKKRKSTKSSGDGKESNSSVRTLLSQLKGQMVTEDTDGKAPTYLWAIEPGDFQDLGVTYVESLFPSPTDFNSWSGDNLPYTVYKNHYLSFLHSSHGQSLLRQIVQGLVSHPERLIQWYSLSDLKTVLVQEILSYADKMLKNGSKT